MRVLQRGALIAAVALAGSMSATRDGIGPIGFIVGAEPGDPRYRGRNP